jgi:vacuolar protein sorting-associated protein 52
MYLTNFQTDLGTVSAEIETLQSRSTGLNTKLENRKIVEQLLRPSVEEISISPAVVRKISEGQVDDEFIRALAELEERSKVILAKSKEQTQPKALEDVMPLLENLKNKVRFRLPEVYPSF